jgi:hypothetical protein
VSSKIHNGPGVVPGRYAGEAIPIHSGPTPEQLAFQQHKTDADGLAGRICAAAAETARSTSVLLELVGEFDAIGGMKHWTGFKSLAHWLSWSCAMRPEWPGSMSGSLGHCGGCRPSLSRRSPIH